MRRFVKLGGTIVAGMILGGTVVAGAVGPTTTDPVTLCIGKGGVVRESATDTCTAKETKVQVASAADVAILAARMDAAEQRVSDLERVVGGELVLDFHAPLGEGWGYSTTGYHLTPFTPVTAWYHDQAGELRSFELGTVGDQGVFFDTDGFSCGLAENVYVVGQGALGEVTSNTLTAPC